MSRYGPQMALGEALTRLKAEEASIRHRLILIQQAIASLEALIRATPGGSSASSSKFRAQATPHARVLAIRSKERS